MRRPAARGRYAPADDSEVSYARDIRRLLAGPGARARPGRLG
jgi:hypothetical protein